ncbi:MAG: hypothetical protein SPL80_08370 [Bacilli bacterium]|nr:hypothetical protein [Bacilli bacterium]
MSNEIESIKTEIEALKQRLEELEKRLNELEATNRPEEKIEFQKHTAVKMSPLLMKKTETRIVTDLVLAYKDVLPGIKLHIRKRKARLQCDVNGVTRVIVWFGEGDGLLKLNYIFPNPESDGNDFGFKIADVEADWRTDSNDVAKLIKPAIEKLALASKKPSESVLRAFPTEPTPQYEQVKPFAKVEPMSKRPNGLMEAKVLFPVLAKGGSIIYPKQPFQVAVGKKKKVYYVNLSEIHLLESWGHPALQMPIDTSKGKGAGFGSNLAAESTLMRCGYSVAKDKKLTDAQRKEILYWAKEGGYLTKEEITSFIDWLIRTRWNMKNMDNAISKWQEDLMYVKGQLK